MIKEVRIMYFPNQNELFYPIENATYLFGVNFSGDCFKENGIHVNDFLPLLKNSGWEIDIKYPEEESDSIKVVLTKEFIETE